MDGLFFSFMTMLYAGWDPDKDPHTTHGPSWGHLQDLAAGGTNSSVHNLISYCQEQTKAPVQLFKMLESWLKKAEHVRPTLLGSGPKDKLISEEIQKTKSVFDSVVADLIGKLLVLSTSLLSTASSLDTNNKNYDVLMGRTTDHQESVTAKVSRLMSLQWKLSRRLT